MARGARLPGSALGGRPGFRFDQRGIAITASMKDFFLDRPLVRKAIGETNQQVLLKAGLNIRSQARRQIGTYPKPKKTKPRPPGRPIHWRKADRTRVVTKGKNKGAIKPEGAIRDIRFAYDPRRRSVFVGFFLLGSRTNPTVPEAHEHGKTFKVLRFVKKGRKLRGRAKRAFLKKYGRKKIPRKTKAQTKIERTKMPKRPTMEIALKKEQKRFAKLWEKALDKWSRRSGRGRPTGSRGKK